MLSACTVGMVPRDLPPPEPATEVPGTTSTEASTDASTTPAAAPVRYELDGNRLALPGPIVFTGEALDAASDPALEHARGYLVAKDVITLMRIEGHADDQAQSERRALTVARWLIAHGIDCKRLIAVGFGPTKPIADTGTLEGRAQNTRIELHNAQMRGKAIGGMPADGGGQLAAADLCQ
ncbi:MAG: OmpA family protein [Nannocystis sp.]|nr:OmpA family protein [Nannocystis sp.]MBA3550164.1 OmpA family protein [Nannocystis sp.]